MSTEDRLIRLGLYHLKDDPEALQRELKTRIEAYDREVAAWNEQRKKEAAMVPPPPEAPATNGDTTESHRWLGPLLARAQEDTDADADATVAKRSAELFELLSLMSIATKVEPRALEKLAQLLATTKESLEAHPNPNGFAAEIVSIAERALRIPREV